MKKIICANGHPRAGKDTFGKYFSTKALGKSKIYKMAEPIGDALKATFSFNNEEYSYYRELGKGRPLFPNVPNSPTFRQCMIDYGEKFLKTTFYPEIFADLLFKKIEADVDDIDNFIITDIGFQCEFDRLCELVEEYNEKNKSDPIRLYLYRIERKSQIPKLSPIRIIGRIFRNAKNFVGDSREWVYKNDKNKRFIMVEKNYNNDGDLDSLKTFVENEIEIMDL